jgi:hypothetical protein
MDYKNKYIKYKLKYIKLKDQFGGTEDDKLFNVYGTPDDITIKPIKYNIGEKNSIINYYFAKEILKKTITYEIKDNIIIFNIRLSAYFTIFIQNNRLITPGYVVLLNDKLSDEQNTQKIYDLIKGNIIYAKHILNMPNETEINGILLKDILKELKLNDINTEKFGLQFKIINKDVLKDNKPNDIEVEKDPLYDDYYSDY